MRYAEERGRRSVRSQYAGFRCDVTRLSTIPSVTRRLLNLVTALSLLLCVGVAVPWGVSVGMALASQPRVTQGWLWVSREPLGEGAVRVRMWNLTVDPRTLDFTRIELNTTPDQADAIGAGFRTTDWRPYPQRGIGFGRPGSNGVTVRLPPWAVVVATGTLPAVRYARHRRRRAARFRKARGLCPACGYDLRASPDRCPECGEVP